MAHGSCGAKMSIEVPNSLPLFGMKVAADSCESIRGDVTYVGKKQSNENRAFVN